MKGVRRKYMLYIGLSFALLCIWLFFMPHYTSTKNMVYKRDGIDVKVRKYYWPREIHFYGILPIPPDGGITPDPHFIGTDIKLFSDDIQKIFGDTKARYQGIDINPWFDKEFSSSLIAIETNSRVFKYAVDMPEKLNKVFTGSGKNIYAFLYKGSIYVYITVGLSVWRPAVIIIPLPLQDNKSVKLSYLDMDDSILLKEIKADKDKLIDLKQFLCEEARSNVAFKLCKDIWK